MACSFCENLREWKELDHAPDLNGEKYHNEFTAALVVRSWYGRRKSGARTVSFKRAGRGFPLNFCPECGLVIEN